ncbi:protease complex subunit PrcB family protein [Thalassolituus sp. LLYu03]|uniref:protease complex subunit PrcB family protein n=1 Tax=Thalassolituus sp. LLYu03 TaxID=3421656 RepID=UPI003D2A8480
MKRILSGLSTALAVTLLATACTTVTSKETQLPMSAMNHCAAPAGVSLSYGSLTVALGERPSAGYGIELVGQLEQAGEYDLTYRETRPQPGRMYAQVITQPCLQVIMPKGWKQVTVTNQDNGKAVTLTPADDTSAVKKSSKTTP